MKGLASVPNAAALCGWRVLLKTGFFFGAEAPEEPAVLVDVEVEDGLAAVAEERAMDFRPVSSLAFCSAARALAVAAGSRVRVRRSFNLYSHYQRYPSRIKI